VRCSSQNTLSQHSHSPECGVDKTTTHSPPQLHSPHHHGPHMLLHTAPAGRVSAPLLTLHHTALCSPAHSLPACCTPPLQAGSQHRCSSHRAVLARTLPARLLHTAPAGRVSAPLLITPRCARPHTPCPPAAHCPCRQRAWAASLSTRTCCGPLRSCAAACRRRGCQRGHRHRWGSGLCVERQCGQWKHHQHGLQEGAPESCGATFYLREKHSS